MGLQAGMGGAGSACPGKTWPAISDVFRRLFTLVFISPFLLLRTPHDLQAVPCLVFFPPAIHPVDILPINLVSLTASSILCLDWSGAGGSGAVDRKERNILSILLVSSWSIHVDMPMS